MVALAELRSQFAGNRRGRRTKREGWILVALVGASFLGYLWGIQEGGWANPYYSAAAQAGARDWGAFFFGSIDWNNAITVDKAPLAVWPMALSVRLFGLSSWAIILPQAIAGAAGVGVLYATVRRAMPAAVAAGAAVVYAATPVVFLMSRYNNPEPVMGLFGLAGIYATVRVIENGRLAWYLVCGTAFGAAFMAKGFQGLLWLPATALAIMLWAPGRLRARIVRLAATSVVMFFTGTWWIAIVSLIPATDRPYIGSSPVNDPWNLAIGYNGVSRLVASQIDTSQTVPYEGGPGRLFNANFAQEIGWTLGPALLCTILVVALRRELNKLERTVAFMGGGCLLTSWAVLSFMADRIHTYYTYSLAAPAAIVLATGVYCALQGTAWVRRAPAAVVVGSAAYFDVRIMGYADGWGQSPWLTSLVGGIAVVLCIAQSLKAVTGEQWRRWMTVGSCLSLCVAPVVTDMVTASTLQSGGFPMSGPSPRDPNAIAHITDEIRRNDPQSLVVEENGAPTTAHVRRDPSLPQGAWLVATYPAQNAALYQLNTQQPALALGGWSGADPSLRLAGFQQLVTAHRIDYFVSFLQLKPYFQDLEVGQIERWVNEHYESTSEDGIIVYDLRRPRTG